MLKGETNLEKFIRIEKEWKAEILNRPDYVPMFECGWWDGEKFTPLEPKP